MSEAAPVKLGHINMRGDAADAAFLSGASSGLGQALPLERNTISRSRHRIYWLGPNEWQVVTDLGNVAELVDKLRRALAGQHVSINDVSGGYRTFHLSGSDVPELLAKGCTLDLHPSVFQMGACAQSGLAKTIVLLGYIEEAPVYEIIVRRSFSEYLQRWLRQN